jgi:hypothetical protein
MTAKFLTALTAGLALAACHNDASPAADASPTPQPTATVVQVIEVPKPVRSSSSPTAIEVATKPTPCGAEKLQNYLNLLPTSTAKDEIAETVGHNRIRYIPLDQAKAAAAPGSNRLTAGLGPDGRIKVFTCG